MRTAARFITFVVLALTAGGCASTAGKAKTQEEPVTTVRVENQAFLDMDVFVLEESGNRIRLGMVTGNSTQVLRLPRGVVFGPTSLRFVVDPIGGNRAPISQSITVTPGDQVQLVIPPT